MADTGFGRTDPFSDVIALVAGPIAAGIRSFEQLRKGADELMRGLENFNATMENLNETAARVNRLLNDFEEPVRAMLPQLTRTVKMADDLSLRLATPIDQVIPGLTRLADTLNSPALRSMPTDLGQFMEVINDLSKRMSPLAQIAEQAGSMFGLRIPGLSRQAAPSGASRPRSWPPRSRRTPPRRRRPRPGRPSRRSGRARRPRRPGSGRRARRRPRRRRPRSAPRPSARPDPLPRVLRPFFGVSLPLSGSEERQKPGSSVGDERGGHDGAGEGGAADVDGDRGAGLHRGGHEAEADAVAEDG